MANYDVKSGNKSTINKLITKLIIDKFLWKYTLNQYILIKKC